MLSIERYEKILDKLNQNKVIKVTELSKSLGVTEKTIRVDLETLEQRGLLRRIHGGAVFQEDEHTIFPIDKRQSMRSDVKLSIAREAYKKINHGETILMDGGSTTLALARILGNFPVTVITNDIKIANELLNKEKVQLMVIGGTRIGKSSSLYGVEANNLLKRIRVNRLFFGTTGVSFTHGLTVLNSLHADWKRESISCADHITLLADSSKFEKVALIQFASLVDIDEIITDSSVDKNIIQQLNNINITVSVAPS